VRSKEAAAPRGRASVPGRDDEGPRDEYDLLIAMALGVVLGTGLTLLFRRGPRGRRPATMMVRAAGRGAAQAGRSGMEGARWMARRGEKMLDSLPVDEVGDAIGEYLDAAREAIDDVVAREVKDLRKAVRRQRKRFGV
jgi:hypothetical protein